MCDRARRNVVVVQSHAGPSVLTNGHTGHVLRAPGFFLSEGPELAVVK